MEKYYAQLWHDGKENQVIEIKCDPIGVDYITVEELSTSINDIKSCMAPGFNGINMELLKYGAIMLHLFIQHLINICWKFYEVSR